MELDDEEKINIVLSYGKLIERIESIIYQEVRQDFQDDIWDQIKRYIDSI